jgi:predicted DNA binding CopG/RHH family protein
MSMFNEEQMARLGINPEEVSNLQKAVDKAEKLDAKEARQKQKTADEAAELQAEEARRQEDNARIGFVFSAKVLSEAENIKLDA